MKNNIVLLSLVMLFVLNYSFAQIAPPYIMVGRVPAYKVEKGKQETATTTCAELLAVPRLIANNPGWEIVSYQFSISPKGNHDIIGPYTVKGTEFTKDVKEALHACTGGRGTVFIEVIKVKTPDGMIRTVVPILLKYEG